MKKTKTYIESDLAKKKVSRYKYWAVKDESGIIISTSDDEGSDKSFSEVLDKIISDNVDAEISVKFGTTEQSARQNIPFFIKVNEEIEWIEPEEETVTINGQQHKVDKNGNVNINFSTPEVQRIEQPKVETARIDTVRQEMDMQLEGLRKEYELKDEKRNAEMQNQLATQMLKFKELMLSDRENRLAVREQILAQKEAEVFDKETQIKEDLSGYLKHVPSALGGLLKEIIKPEKADSLGKTDEKKSKPKKERRKVNFQVKEPTLDEFDEEIKREEEFEREFAKELEKEKLELEQQNTNPIKEEDHADV